MSDKLWVESNKFRARSSKTLSKSRQKIRNRILLNSYLENHPCVDCGEADIRCLDFDHVNGEKKCALSRMKNRGYSIETINKEINKCVIRCANCHRKKHYSLTNTPPLTEFKLIDVGLRRNNLFGTCQTITDLHSNVTEE